MHYGTFIIYNLEIYVELSKYMSSCSGNLYFLHIGSEAVGMQQGCCQGRMSYFILFCMGYGICPALNKVNHPPTHASLLPVAHKSAIRANSLCIVDEGCTKRRPTSDGSLFRNISFTNSLLNEPCAYMSVAIKRSAG